MRKSWGFMESDNIRKFVEGFFRNLKCDVRSEGVVLVVENPPGDFEKFSGKKGPYYFIFEQNNACPINDKFELVSKGSYLLKTMTQYLDNRGQTTLLRLNFETSEQEVKDYLKLKNCSVFSINKRVTNKDFLRFTFLTTFQYLNEKEQVMNSIFVRDGKVVDFDLDKFGVGEGKKQELPDLDVKEGYVLAKDKLKQLLEVKIGEIGEELDGKLLKEVERIKHHYVNQIREVDQEREKLEKQISDLEAGDTNGDLKNIPVRINKLREQIDELKKSEKKEKLEKEMQFFIDDETHKHGLNIDNKLMNTTVIYYPVFDFSIFLKNNETGRQLDLVYEPLDKKITSVFCDSCKNKIDEIILCSSGHIVCAGCSSKCGSCGKDTCRDCLVRSCGMCGVSLCKKCSSRCLKCGRYLCRNHVKKDPVTRGDFCSNCLKTCPFCGKSNERVRACNLCGAGISCENCAISNKVYCKKCYQECSGCGEIKKKSDFSRCCDYKDCNHLSRCMDCRKKLCVRLKMKKV